MNNAETLTQIQVPFLLVKRVLPSEIAGMDEAKMTTAAIQEMKGREPIPALTAYDFPTAKILDEAGIPLLLVGDSLGMVVLGYPNTTHVTIEDILHHLRAVVRAEPKALIVADLPYRSYSNERDAVENARRLMEAGADAVKAEGSRSISSQIKAIRSEGIPLMGHLGMLPQHVLEEGRYRIKGKKNSERDALLEDAKFLEQVGAFSVVLELVTPPVARELTDRLLIPTIGIGSGADCDGQIRVTHDIIGTYPWFRPKFAENKLEGAELIRQAVTQWSTDVRSKVSAQC